MNDRLDRLEVLLAEFVERRERGEPITAAQFADEHPGLRAELLPALASLERTAALLPAGDLPPFLGPYRIDARLGSGGTGEVFAARTEDGRDVAIKCLLPHMRLQPRAIERLRREGSVLQDIDHPGIVKIESTGVGDGNVFLVMERIDGGSLADVLQAAKQRRAGGATGSAADMLELPSEDGRGVSGQRRAIELVAGLARALAVAHSRGLLHRDLKPGNVLLRPDGRPVLVDFGLAFDPEADTLTKTGDVLGTPNYMAPEQAFGREATEQSDIYGLAAILYELVTLQPPHHGGDALQVLSAVRDAPPKPARSIEPSVSPDLERVLRRALARRPENRWLSAEQFADALDALLAGSRPAHASISLPQRIEEFWLWHRRGVLTVAAGVIVAGLAFALWQSQSASRQARTNAAIEAAITASLDDGAKGRAKAATLLAEAGTEPALAAWFAGEGAGEDPYVQALDRGTKLRRKQPTEAVIAFREAMALRSDLPLAGAWLGIAAADAGNRQLAEGNDEVAERDHELAERELIAAGRILTRCVRVRRELGTVRRRRGDHAGSAEAWREVVALRDDEPRYWYELARAAISAKQPEEALVSINRALELHGGEPPASWLHVKGAILDTLDRRDEGIALLRDAISRRPLANTWNSLGQLLDKEHRLHEAAEAYRQGIGCDPKRASNLFCLAFLLAGSKSYECEDCAAYFAQHPDLYDPAGAEDLALQMLEAQHGDFTHAEQVADIVVRVDHGDRFRQKLDELLTQDFPNDALGRLLRARRKLP